MGVLAGFLEFGHCHFFSCSLKEKRAAVGEVKVLSHVLSLEGMCCRSCASPFALLASGRDGSRGRLPHPSHPEAEAGLYLSQSSSQLVVPEQPPFVSSWSQRGCSGWESSCSAAAVLLQEPSGTGEAAAADDCALKCNSSAQIFGQDLLSAGPSNSWKHS